MDAKIWIWISIMLSFELKPITILLPARMRWDDGKSVDLTCFFSASMERKVRNLIETRLNRQQSMDLGSYLFSIFYPLSHLSTSTRPISMIQLLAVQSCRLPTKPRYTSKRYYGVQCTSISFRQRSWLRRETHRDHLLPIKSTIYQMPSGTF